MYSYELQIGKAGEHLVCVDLLLKGWNTFLADQGCPFDLVAEKPPEHRLYRVQVKTTHTKRWKYYQFSVGTVSPDTADVLALVTLDTREVHYIKVEEGLAPTIYLASLSSGPLTSLKSVRTHYKEDLEEFPL